MIRNIIWFWFDLIWVFIMTYHLYKYTMHYTNFLKSHWLSIDEIALRNWLRWYCQIIIKLCKVLLYIWQDFLSIKSDLALTHYLLFVSCWIRDCQFCPTCMSNGLFLLLSMIKSYYPWWLYVILDKQVK